MKTAVSIPDDVFAGAERLARKTKKSRSQLFSEAVREYVARHGSDDVTAAMNRACARVGDSRDEFRDVAARRVLERSDWKSRRARSGGPICRVRPGRAGGTAGL